MSDFKDFGVDISHHFGGGVYMKQAEIPAGRLLSQHVHKFDHLAVLVSGAASLEVEGKKTHHVGPCVILIPAGKNHLVTSITDVTWMCVWSTDLLDPDEVDKAVIA